MARAGFIDHRRAKVEAKNGDACIISFTGDLNSLVNERFDNALSESQEEAFNTHYGVHYPFPVGPGAGTNADRGTYRAII